MKSDIFVALAAAAPLLARYARLARGAKGTPFTVDHLPLQARYI